jgi:hypothetical protein
VRRVLWLLAWLATMGGVLRADWKIVTRTGGETVTEYFKGAFERRDFGPSYATVLDPNHRSQVMWRSDLRQYMVAEFPPDLRPADSQEGPVIVIVRTSRDTGERKSFFGRSARHVITHMTRGDGPETNIDGWYVQAAGLPKRSRAAGGAIILTTVAGGQRPVIPRIEVKQEGPAPEGLAVWEKTSWSIALPGGARQSHETVSEVVELVEGPLPDRLFHEPEGYQRVALLPGPARGDESWMQAHWRMLREWFAGLLGTGR